MLYKIRQVFDRITEKTNAKVVNKEQLDQLYKKLFERKIIVEHDIPLINKYIVDFPFNFEQFCNYIRQIYKMDIEGQLENKLFTFNDVLSKILKYLNFYSYSELNSDDLYEILNNLNLNLVNAKSSLSNINKVDFLLKNIRDDIQKFLWEKIYQNQNFKSEKNEPELFITSADEYQQLYQAKIEYEFEIIRSRKVQYDNVLNKKPKKISIDVTRCGDRGIPILTYKIQNDYFDREVLTDFFYKCEALRQLILSKYYQKFLGFDDFSMDECQLYFFENIEGTNILNLITKLDLDVSESSILFKYLAKEILTAFRDLLYKCTYSVKLPISINNIFYDTNQFRLYVHNINFGPIRKTILESHGIVEAKLLYFYAIILINILAINKPELKELLNFINSLTNDFQEFDHMQKLFDHIIYIEEVLTKNLENDIIISIIIECLISPYKAKFVFDEFYNKKNFLQKILDPTREEIQTKKKTDLVIQNDEEDGDKKIAFEPYYEKTKEVENESLANRVMSLNLLLIHPYFDSLKLENSFLSFLFKNN